MEQQQPKSKQQQGLSKSTGFEITINGRTQEVPQVYIDTKCEMMKADIEWLKNNVPKDIEHASRSEQISASKLGTQMELDVFLTAQVSKLMDFYGVMHDKMCESIVDRIMQDCWDMKIGDIALAMRWGVQERWGKNYGKFNGAIMMNWIAEYRKERMDYYEAKHSGSGQRAKVEGKSMSIGKAITKGFTNEQIETIKRIENSKKDETDQAEKKKQKTSED